MFQEYIMALTFIFVAEMGDKTQILAMAFATQYSVKKVLLGIFIGALLNHGLAVLLGRCLSTVIPINRIQIVAGIVFIAFALWTLKGETDDDESGRDELKFGPVMTVAIAFFIGELGDKTQLTAITLAADAVYPLFILLGTVSGMIVTGGMGIFIGKKLGKKVPELLIKIIAATIFMLFGLLKLYQNLPRSYLTLPFITLPLMLLGVVVYLLLRRVLKK